jgi:hypothetical protein
MRLFFVLAIAATTMGCQTQEPTLVIGGCIDPAVQAVQKSGTGAEARCDFGRSTTLLAIPAGQPSRDELAAAGLPEDAVYTLMKVRTTEPRWCTVDKVEAAVAGVKPGWDARCVATQLDIASLTTVSSQSVVVSLSPSSNGGVRLVALVPGAKVQ